MASNSTNMSNTHEFVARNKLILILPYSFETRPGWQLPKKRNESTTTARLEHHDLWWHSLHLRVERVFKSSDPFLHLLMSLVPLLYSISWDWLKVESHCVRRRTGAPLKDTAKRRLKYGAHATHSLLKSWLQSTIPNCTHWCQMPNPHVAWGYTRA